MVDSFIPTDLMIGELVLEAHKEVGRTSRTAEMGAAIRELLRAGGFVLLIVRTSAVAAAEPPCEDEQAPA